METARTFTVTFSVQGYRGEDGKPVAYMVTATHPLAARVTAESMYLREVRQGYRKPSYRMWHVNTLETTR